MHHLHGMCFVNAIAAAQARADTWIYCLLENLADREQEILAWMEVQHLKF
jgi:hypothetical protein